MGLFAPLWTFLHAPGPLVQGPYQVFVAYPIVPWIAVIAAGYLLGAVYQWNPVRRRSFLLRLGSALALAFVILRGVNLYGDPARWHTQRSFGFTILSFLNTTKYPPSLLFLLMTLSLTLLLLGLFDAATPGLLRPVLVYGRVPLFYFALHAALIHLIALAVCFVRYGQVHWMFESSSAGNYPITPPPGWGLTLPYLYLIWMLVVLALYPLCARFAALKARRSSRWLSYL
jgi:uncharacterized membrane protein